MVMMARKGVRHRAVVAHDGLDGHAAEEEDEDHLEGRHVVGRAPADEAEDEGRHD
jgi:hypothetical protein